jgi:hypothetical protein
MKDLRRRQAEFLTELTGLRNDPINGIGSGTNQGAVVMGNAWYHHLGFSLGGGSLGLGETPTTLNPSGGMELKSV